MPVSLFLRRPLHAMRRLHTAVPLGRAFISGSLVRFPVTITRLMLLPATEGSFPMNGISSWPSLGRGEAAIGDVRRKWAETFESCGGEDAGRDEHGTFAPSTRELPVLNR